jgi:hypothetical protein
MWNYTFRSEQNDEHQPQFTENEQLINKLLFQCNSFNNSPIALTIQDFIALSELSDDYYFKMLASDLQHIGSPSYNLRYAYSSQRTNCYHHNAGYPLFKPIEKTNGMWVLENGCFKKMERK